MTRNELDNILDFRCWPTAKNQIMEIVWGQPFDGETEKIAERDAGEDRETTNRKLKNLFDQVKELQEIKQNQEAVELQMAHQIDGLKAALKAITNTTKSVSSTCQATEEPSAVVMESFTTQPQPIATAPKGRRILLYCPRKVESEGWWQVGTFDEDTCRWIDDDYEPGCMLVQPTYWLPWPAHPTQPKPNP